MSAKSELLVALDGSTHSDRVMLFACDMAKRLGARVHILYVSPVLHVPEAYVEFAKIEKVDVQGYNEAIGRAVLKKFEATAKKEGVDYDSDLEHGNPAQVIEKYSREGPVLAVVVGLRGLHGLGRIRSLGSVARRVLEGSTVPVLVVPS